MVSLEAIVSGMGYAVLALLLGTLVAAGFLLPTGEPKELRQTLLRAGAYLVIVFLIIAVVSLLIQGAKLRQGTLPSIDVLVRYLTMTQSGKIWLLREAYGAALAVVIFRVREKLGERKSKHVGFSCSLSLLWQAAALPVMPSLLKENTMVVVAADAAHLIATGLWGGGLLTLFGFSIVA